MARDTAVRVINVKKLPRSVKNAFFGLCVEEIRPPYMLWAQVRFGTQHALKVIREMTMKRAVACLLVGKEKFCLSYRLENR